MTDDKSIEAQPHEIPKIAHEIIGEGFQEHPKAQNEGVLTGKSNHWKHDKKEEVNAIPKKKPTAVLKSKGNKMKRGSNKQNNPQSRSTVQIVCYNCNKLGHLARNYRNRSRPGAFHNRNFSTRLCGTCLARSTSQPFEIQNPRTNLRYDVASLHVLGKMFL
ncbi:uncharacterized protein E6C27_scaffold675G001990 [Cucumis melo var. makuwa]|uniref:CCHC-type domain-containing protein n=1 Tax=Cucumis melo var. makuwa TaxID=1194695 RepID=A0A5A7U7L2_CUCMM|nr:uncharacterized protein E6C27_scaffold675G001990 [Cucumis melo var. makuwa]